MLHFSKIQKTSALLIPLAIAALLSGCGIPVQHVAQDCKNQNETSFVGFADCTKSNFMADPSGTSTSYYNPYLEELKKLSSLVRKKKLTDDEAFYEEAKFRLALDTSFSKIEEPRRTATGAMLMGIGTGMLQKPGAAPVAAPTNINCYSHSTSDSTWTNCH